jgi:predicted nuclease of predicted toxin-antitoxin system
MRLLLDQGAPRDTSLRLRDAGFECPHVGEIGMSRATDTEILAWAVSQNAIVVTLDADFRTILAVSGAASPFVVRLCVQGLNAGGIADVVEEVLKDFAGTLTQGTLVTVKTHKITCPQLPVGSIRSARLLPSL